MGYQESYIKMKDSKDFERLVEVIRRSGKKKFEWTTPVRIITLLKPIKVNLWFMGYPKVNVKFEKGEKFIYVVGERHGQRCPSYFFEYCKNVDRNIIDNLEIYFTECFPSHDIFENNHKTNMAIHEEFTWNKKMIKHSKIP